MLPGLYSETLSQKSFSVSVTGPGPTLTLAASGITALVSAMVSPLPLLCTDWQKPWLLPPVLPLVCLHDHTYPAGLLLIQVQAQEEFVKVIWV